MDLRSLSKIESTMDAKGPQGHAPHPSQRACSQRNILIMQQRFPGIESTICCPSKA